MYELDPNAKQWLDCAEFLLGLNSPCASEEGCSSATLHCSCHANQEKLLELFILVTEHLKSQPSVSLKSRVLQNTRQSDKTSE